MVAAIPADCGVAEHVESKQSIDMIVDDPRISDVPAMKISAPDAAARLWANMSSFTVSQMGMCPQVPAGTDYRKAIELLESSITP